MTDMRERIEEKLKEVFKPEQLVVIDESHKHIGHAGARPEGQTHFRVKIIVPQFAGLSRVKIHQLIYKALEDELRHGVHALAIEAYAAEATA